MHTTDLLLAVVVATAITLQMVVTMLISVVAPAVVSLITKASTEAWVKAVLIALISALVGIGQGFVDTPPGVTWDWIAAVFYAFIAFITSVSIYFGLLKPTGVADTLQRTLVKDPVVLPEDQHAPVWLPPVPDSVRLPDPNTYTAD